MTDPEILPDSTDVEKLENEPGDIYVAVPGNRGQVAGHVHGDMNLTIVKRVKGLREAHELGPGYVRRSLETFVERSFENSSQRFDSVKASELLRRQHCLVLVGEPDTGRRTAAIAVLGRLGLPLEEIPSWDPGQPGQFTVADLPAEPGTGYLFMHPDGETASPELGDELRTYHEKLGRIGAFLVFVTTAAGWHAAGGIRTEAVLTVGAPHRLALLDAVARSYGPRHELDRIVSDSRIAELALKANPREVTRLADLMVRIADDPDADLEVEADRERVIAEIIGGYQEWTHELKQWFRQHSGAQERLFLVAAAVLEGSSASLILRNAEDLGKLLDRSQPDHLSITAPGIRDLADRIGAEILEPQNVLHFRRPAYAPAIVDFLLSDRSDGFRSALSTWLARAPRVNNQAEAAAVADLVAGTVLSIVQRRGDIAFLNPMVDAWSTPRALRPVLVSLLTAVALSPEAGAPMRAKLNRWAAKSASLDLCQVVADVCTGDFADTYPRSALTRVNNLAQRASGALIPVVVTAVEKLWERRTMRRDILFRVITWLIDPNRPAFAVGTEILTVLRTDAIKVAFTERLDSDPALCIAVGNVLQSLDNPELLRDTLYDWLDLALVEPLFADWFIAVVTAAVPGPGSALRITCVRTFAYGWESRETDSQRSALRERLVDRVSNADRTIRGWNMAVETEGDHSERAA
jgi:hypothetical protein